MDYEESKKWLNSLHIAMRGFGLENIRRMLAETGTPHEKLRAIHVAGSNGKGSVSAYLESILREQGHKTGLYTSPHLIEPTERIRVNNRKISETKFARLASEFRNAMRGKKIRANYFEVMTAMGIRHFIDCGVDVAVMEAGMGGRLDATNILEGKAAAITSISLEHTQYLGRTIPKIAREKAGVIKEGACVVIGENNRGIGEISKAARKKKAKLFRAGVKVKKSDSAGQEFDLVKPWKINGLRTKMLGEFQCENAGLAIACAKCLNEKGIKVSEKAIRKGTEKTFWRARMQIISKRPLVIVDSAHNPDGWDSLFKALRKFEFEKMFVVFGAMSDKDVSKAKKHLAKAEEIFLTKSDSYRAEKPKKLRKKIGFGKIIENPEKAMKEAMRRAGKKDLVLVAGSIYLAGKVLAKKIR